MKRTLIFVCLGLIILAIALRHSPHSSLPLPQTPKAAGVLGSSGISFAADVSTHTATGNAAAPSPSATPTVTGEDPKVIEKASLKAMVETVCKFAVGQKNLEGLVSQLKSSNEDPMIVRDSNPYTGDMVIIRTNNPPAGTRYFHAQYFEGPGGQQFPQHISFEFKPGPDAMKVVEEVVQTSCDGLGKPASQKDDFVQWNRGGGYVLWIKRLDAKDLENDPFNAYTAEDAGSIRVAIELNPEEGQ